MRRSKRKRSQVLRRFPEFFSRCCEELEKVGGLNRATNYVSVAEIDLIKEANEMGIGPVVRAIYVCGATSSKRGVEPKSLLKLKQFLLTCVLAGANVSLGCPCSGTKWQLPIIAASYFGMFQIVEILLEQNASPGYANADGMTALHTALINPTGSSRNNRLRSCDLQTAQLFKDRGLLVEDVCLARRVQPIGSVIYVGSEKMSPLYYAVLNKNLDALIFLYSVGATLSDRDYLHLCRDRKARKHIRRLLPAIVSVMKHYNIRRTTGELFDLRNVRIYDVRLGWSYPSSWHRAFILTHHLNLPREVFLHVASYCSRGWFFKTDEPDMDKDFPSEFLAPLQKAVSFYSFRTSF